METTGGSIEISDIDELIQTEDIKCLGEIMNYYEIIYDPDCKTNQILSHIRSRYPDLIIEGHVPKLLDLDLQKIAYAGVNSDHTHQTVEGMDARIAAGMFLEIQEKSMTKEVIVINKLLLSMGLIDKPLDILYTPTAIIIGLVHFFLSFIIVTLVGGMENIETDLD